MEARRVEAERELAVLTRGESRRALLATRLVCVEGGTLEEAGARLEVSGRTVERMLGRLRERWARLGGPGE